MRFLVATKDTQGQRKNDFSHAREGELVKFGFECDGEEVDGNCGCRRALSGMDTGLATTTMKVVEMDMKPSALLTILQACLRKEGWIKEGPIDKEWKKQSMDDAGELIRIANYFPVGTIVEKRGDTFGARLVLDRVECFNKSQHPPVYGVYSKNEELWWSNELGWVDVDSATVFTEVERHRLNLPIGGEWKLFKI